MIRVTKLALPVLCALLIGCGGEPEEDASAEPAGTAKESPFAAYVGTWHIVAMNEAGDSLTSYEMMATEDPSGWMARFPDRDPMPVQVQSTPDGIMTMFGPYESVLRDGVTVTVTANAQVQGDEITGTFEGRYANAGADSLLVGRLRGTRVR